MAGGYNHYWDCGCPWCEHRRSTSRHGGTLVRRQPYIYESLVNPNAHCPECGDRVFFYQSPAGGKVLFDELGPPWPKHPCTDHTPTAMPRAAGRRLGVRVASRPSWKDDGWTPLRIVSLHQGLMEMGRRKSDWWVIDARDVRTGHTVHLLTDVDVGLRANDFAYHSTWSKRGTATLSWLAGVSAEPTECLVWHPDHYGDITVEHLRSYEHLTRKEARRVALEDVLAARRENY